IHVRQAEMAGERACDGPLPARRRTIDGDHGSLLFSFRRSHVAARFDRGICLWQGAPPNAPAIRSGADDILLELRSKMVKPEWGAKRTCPKCSTRFYDLGNEDPVHCVSCGTEWMPEPVLKSKQPLTFEAPPVANKEPEKEDELAAEDLAIDEDAEISADEEVDLETG